MNVKISSGGKQYINVPSENNRNIGILVIIVAFFIGSGLATYFNNGNLFYLSIPLFFIAFVILFKQDTIFINSSFLEIQYLKGPTHKFHLEKNSKIVLLYEITRDWGKGYHALWQVLLRNKTFTHNEEYLIASKMDGHFEMRTLAETICKLTKLPLVCNFDAVTEPVMMEAKDLDLPFRERVKKFPWLMGEEVQAPQKLRIQYDTCSLQGKSFTWNIFSTNPLIVIAFIIVVILFVLFCSLIATTSSNLIGLSILSTGFAVIVMVIGLRYKLIIGRDNVILTGSFCGAILYTITIPLNEIEDVCVVKTSYGGVLKIISDQNIMTAKNYQSLNKDEMMTVLWMAYQIKKELVK